MLAPRVPLACAAWHGQMHILALSGSAAEGVLPRFFRPHGGMPVVVKGVKHLRWSSVIADVASLQLRGGRAPELLGAGGHRGGRHAAATGGPGYASRRRLERRRTGRVGPAKRCRAGVHTGRARRGVRTGRAFACVCLGCARTQDVRACTERVRTGHGCVGCVRAGCERGVRTRGVRARRVRAPCSGRVRAQARARKAVRARRASACGLGGTVHLVALLGWLARGLVRLALRSRGAVRPLSAAARACRCRACEGPRHFGRTWEGGRGGRVGRCFAGFRWCASQG